MSPSLITSYIVVLALILGCLQLHLVGPAFIGMLVYSLSLKLSQRLSNYMPEHYARLSAIGLIAIFIVGVFIIAGGRVTHYFDNVGSFSGLANKMADVLVQIRSKLPAQVLDYLPENFLELKDNLAQALRIHAKEIETASREGLHTLVHVIVAMVIAALLALKRFGNNQNSKPLGAAIRQRLRNLTHAFEAVIFAQAKISAINTGLTAIYLLIFLPLLGISLPYSKTLVLITFFTGLIPIIGNIFSNTLIVLISLGISFQLALMSLAFLIIIHKLEYFINAKIVGGRIHADAWELILAMLIMETAYGLPGLLVAPTLYAYFKFELVRLELV